MCYAVGEEEEESFGWLTHNCACIVVAQRRTFDFIMELDKSFGQKALLSRIYAFWFSRFVLWNAQLVVLSLCDPLTFAFLFLGFDGDFH